MKRRFGLIPREESFFDLFEELAAVARECLPILGTMREARAIDPQWAEAMGAIEQRGDRLTSRLIQKAEQTFITPLDREDILALAIAIDDVLDFIEEFTVKLVDYHLLPDGALRAFFDLVARAVSCMAEGVVHLRTFRPIEETRTQMKDCEHTADTLVRTIIRESYALVIPDLVHQGETTAVTAQDLQRVFDAYHAKRQCREIAELSEAAVDACERVFHVLRNIYLKEL
jgi:uncharacterized protein Yka (UPF0111/DUF47 family)